MRKEEWAAWWACYAVSRYKKGVHSGVQDLEAMMHMAINPDGFSLDTITPVIGSLIQFSLTLQRAPGCHGTIKQYIKVKLAIV